MNIFKGNSRVISTIDMSVLCRVLSHSCNARPSSTQMLIVRAYGVERYFVWLLPGRMPVRLIIKPKDPRSNFQIWILRSG
jgi:hypothetical protein